MPGLGDSVFDDFHSPEEVQLAQQQYDQQNVNEQRSPYMQDIAMANQAGNNAANQLGNATGNPNVGTPQVVQARRISSVMQEIMAGANQLPDNTDPMDKNLYVAKQIANKMWDVSPQLAGKAMLQAQQLEEAKTQQAKLVAQTQQEQAKTAGMQQQQKITDLTNKNAVLVDNQGNVVWSHPTDDPAFTAALAKARQDNPNATLSSEAQYNQSDIKQRVALIQAQSKVDAAMLRASAQGQKLAPEDRQAIQQVRKMNPGLVNIASSGMQIADILNSAPDAMTIGAHVSSKLDNVFQSIVGSLKASAVDPANPSAVDDAMAANNSVVKNGLAQADKTMPGWQGNAALHTAAMQMAFALAQGNVNGRVTNYEVQQSIHMLSLAASGDKRQALTSLNTILAQKQAQASNFVDSIGARDVPGVPEMLQFSSGKLKDAQDKINGMLAASKVSQIPNIGQQAPSAKGETPTYATPEDIKAAYTSGKLTRDQAKKLLQTQHGMQ